MSWLILAPILVPAGTAFVSLLLWRHLFWQKALAVLGAGGTLAASLWLVGAVHAQGVMATQLGNWPAPFGISFVADHLSAVMTALAALMGFAAAVYALGDVDEARFRHAFFPLFHILLMGVNGAFLTGDLFNLYVWFEVLLIASFALMALGGGRIQMDGAVKYAFINLFSSLLLLSAIGLTYGMTGTLNMAELALLLPETGAAGLVTTVAMLFLVAFGIKAAIFPLFFWLPASYHVPPVTVSAYFAGMLTKVGVYALIRAFTLLFAQDTSYTHTLLLWLSGVTMLSGVLGAAAQFEFRRILAFHSVSQVGYMVMGLALMSPLALAGSLVFMVHHSLVKANLFLVSGVAKRLAGSFQLRKLGGLYQSAPALSAIFVLAAFSLAGFPPLTGFWAKFLLVRAGLELEAYAIVAAALLTGLLTLYSMVKIWAEAFWKPLPEGSAPEPERVGALAAFYLPMLLLAGATLLLGLFFTPLLALAEGAARELLDPAHYIRAVLGEGARLGEGP
ncbi:proton-conducting transporter transmembrane domain-containing protein [Thermus sediminis]|uniref:proton-conducting transporter transmembrane domain-containing protein n=1 Tax=Thermus sediminis TaxID=1761908 RepID=UPI000E3DCCA6|nr:proton-conducting transporter membrane subunit [Thermus sediminis]